MEAHTLARTATSIPAGPRADDTGDAGRESAQDRFRRRRGERTAVALILSVGLHFAAFQAFPELRIALPDVAVGGLEAVDLPPEVEVPPPPEAVARPATPTVAQADVSEDVTIAPTTFEANPAEALPPPPKAQATRPSEQPVFIPREVEPRLRNGEEIRKLLMRFYPPPLRDAGIGGKVVIWLYVSTEGSVVEALVKEPSPYEAFNAAALKVADHMEYVPAANRGNPVAVWVAQRIRFEVRG